MDAETAELLEVLAARLRDGSIHAVMVDAKPADDDGLGFAGSTNYTLAVLFTTASVPPFGFEWPPLTTPE